MQVQAQPLPQKVLRVLPGALQCWCLIDQSALSAGVLQHVLDIL
jgi:hypothetical protein